MGQNLKKMLDINNRNFATTVFVIAQKENRLNFFINR